MSCRIFTAAAALAGALILSGCVSGAPTPSDAAPVPSVSPTPTATEELVDPLSLITTVVARPEALELRDGSGAVTATLDYRSETATAIATLETVFGSEPVSEDYQGTSHYPPSTAHRWGDFELWEQRYVDNWADVVEDGPTLFQPAFKVQFTGPEASGVVLTDVGDRLVGSSWADLMSDPGILTNPSGCSGPYVDYVAFEVERHDGVKQMEKVSVDFRATEDNASIEEIRAPMPVYDGCA